MRERLGEDSLDQQETAQDARVVESVRALRAEFEGVLNRVRVPEDLPAEFLEQRQAFALRDDRHGRPFLPERHVEPPHWRRLQQAAVNAAKLDHDRQADGSATVIALQVDRLPPELRSAVEEAIGPDAHRALLSVHLEETPSKDALRARSIDVTKVSGETLSLGRAAERRGVDPAVYWFAESQAALEVQNETVLRENEPIVVTLEAGRAVGVAKAAELRSLMPFRGVDSAHKAFVDVRLARSPEFGDWGAEGVSYRLGPHRLELVNEALKEDRLQRQIEAAWAALGEAPPRVRLREHERPHSQGHTIKRHSPALPLDGATDECTVRGRLDGGTGWDKPAPASYKWVSETVMHATVNDYLRDNWSNIRLDLVMSGEHSGSVTADGVLGEGFYDNNYLNYSLSLNKKGVVEMKYDQQQPADVRYSKTNMARITLRYIKGPPPSFFVLTAYPEVVRRDGKR